MFFIRSTETKYNTQILQAPVESSYFPAVYDQRSQKFLHYSKLQIGSSMEKFVKELLSRDYSLQKTFSMLYK